METTGQDSRIRQLRHDARGRFNALKLSVTALEILADPREEVEFLQMVIESAEGTAAALDDLEAAGGMGE